MGDCLSEEQVEDVRNLFLTFGKDSDGKATKAEVEAALRERNTNLSNEELEFMMRMIDIADNGVVSFEEFLKMAALCECGEDLSELQVKQLFRAFDKDGDGVLSSDEIKQIWNIWQRQATDGNARRLSDEEMNAMIKVIDENGDGQIDYEEFYKAFRYFPVNK